MNNALIDIGSNTIRFTAYDGTEEIENFADYAGLIAEVSNGEISFEGVCKIIRALTLMKKKAESLNCEKVYAFATASLRGIDDKPRLISLIKEACGIEINIISGEDECRYDYLGLKSQNDFTDGCAFDLGGGSCQILVARNDNIIESGSVAIGALKLYSEFVSGVLPCDNERRAISDHVRKTISRFKSLKNSGGRIYAMGGSVFALLSLAEKYLDASGVLTRHTLRELCNLTEDMIVKVQPNRLKTVIPAALVMSEIIDYSGGECIVPTKAGVRDGIIHKMLLEQK